MRHLDDGGAAPTTLELGVFMRNAVVPSVVLTIVFAACGGDGGTQPPPPPVFTSLAVSPTNPALVDGDVLQLVATPRDQNGTAMTGLAGSATFALTSGDAVSVSGTGVVTARKAGAAVVTASLTASGTTKTGTSNPTVTALGLNASVTASGGGQTFNPDTSKIAAGGAVEWSFPGPTAHNVTFTSPPAAVANIATRSSGAESRTFTVTGTYPYRCTIHAGMNGVVIVRTPTP
jgi:plastocyanin